MSHPFEMWSDRISAAQSVEARRELEQSANTAIQRVQQVGAVLGQGVKATAESAKSVLSTPVSQKAESTNAAPATAAKATPAAVPKKAATNTTKQ